MAAVTWSSYQRQDSGTIWLDLVGDLRGSAAEPLRSTVVQTIEVHQPERLLIGLDTVSGIDTAGMTVLMSGYLAAIGQARLGASAVVSPHGPGGSRGRGPGG